MFAERPIPCNPSHHSRFDVRTENPNLRRCGDFRFQWIIIEPYHAVYSFVCGISSSMGSGNFITKKKPQRWAFEYWMFPCFFQDTLSLRLKSIHVVNNSYLFNMLFSIFKPFIREKLRKRVSWKLIRRRIDSAILKILSCLFLQIIFHGKNLTTLQNFFGVDCLPVEYGGKISIPEGTGIAMANLFQLYTKEFESKRQH